MGTPRSRVTSHSGVVLWSRKIGFLERNKRSSCDYYLAFCNR